MPQLHSRSAAYCVWSNEMKFIPSIGGSKKWNSCSSSLQASNYKRTRFWNNFLKQELSAVCVGRGQVKCVNLIVSIAHHSIGVMRSWYIQAKSFKLNQCTNKWDGFGAAWWYNWKEAWFLNHTQFKHQSLQLTHPKVAPTATPPTAPAAAATAGCMLSLPLWAVRSAVQSASITSPASPVRVWC